MPLDPIALKSLAIELATALPPAPTAITEQPIDLSPRAVSIRAIRRIADAHCWHDAVVHYLETRGVAYLSDLSQPQLDDLADRMAGYVDAADTGCSLPDCLSAS